MWDATFSRVREHLHWKGSHEEFDLAETESNDSYSYIDRDFNPEAERLPCSQQLLAITGSWYRGACAQKGEVCGEQVIDNLQLDKDFCEWQSWDKDLWRYMSQIKPASGPTFVGKTQGNTPNLFWRRISFDQLRFQSQYVGLPPPDQLHLESTADYRNVRQESQLWTELHQGLLTTGRLNAALGFYEPAAAKRLGIPRDRVPRAAPALQLEGREEYEWHGEAHKRLQPCLVSCTFFQTVNWRKLGFAGEVREVANNGKAKRLYRLSDSGPYSRVPCHFVPQLQMEMLASGANSALVVSRSATQGVRVFRMQRHAVFLQQMLHTISQLYTRQELCTRSQEP
ncbi:hypothetical protein WJX79_006764 [Trebouxia sp. C0005]